MHTIDTESGVSQQAFGSSKGVCVNGEPIQLTDRTPTGQQVLAAASLRPETEYALLLWPPTGPTREVGLEEVTPLPKDGSGLEFIAVRADHVAYFVLDDERFAWAGPLGVETLRRIGRVSANRELWQERRDTPDSMLEPGTLVNLDATGVERFYTREKVWRLDVQGEPTEWDRPEVRVRDALSKAGIDLTKSWTMVFKVKGKEPRPVGLDDVLDLREPGIERLWLRPRHVDNGEGPAPRRQFDLLPKDESFLEASGYWWETVTEGGRRWLIIEGYPVPKGYNNMRCRLALEIPGTYPAAQIDMFYCAPPLSLANGGMPPATEARQAIAGATFQRWSRHRNANGQWSPSRDNVITHLGLVDEALGREVGA